MNITDIIKHSTAFIMRMKDDISELSMMRCNRVNLTHLSFIIHQNEKKIPKHRN